MREVGEKGGWIDKGRVWWKFSFEVDVEGDVEGMVKLDEDEHQDFLWITEEECRAGVVEREGKKVEIKWAFKGQLETILEGFKLRRENEAGL